MSYICQYCGGPLNTGFTCRDCGKSNQPAAAAPVEEMKEAQDFEKSAFVVSLEDYRELERELAEARRELAMIEGVAQANLNMMLRAKADLAEARNAAMEEAAKVADSTVCDTHLPTGIKIYGHVAGRAIRALKINAGGTPSVLRGEVESPGHSGVKKHG